MTLDLTATEELTIPAPLMGCASVNQVVFFYRELYGMFRSCYFWGPRCCGLFVGVTAMQSSIDLKMG